MSTPSPTRGDVGSIPTESSFEDTLTAVCEAAVKIVGVDHSGLVLFSQDHQYGIVRAEYPTGTISAVRQKVAVSGIPLEEQLLNERKPMVVNDVASEGLLGTVQKLLLDLGIKSLVVVPIIVDGQVKGSFSFDSINRIREFQDSDVEKCSCLAEFASIVVKNAYLLENLEALRQAMLAIASEQERVPLLKAITKEAANLIHASGGGIDELDERKGELTIVAQYNMPDEIVGKTMNVGEGLAGLIIKDNLDYHAVPNYPAWDGRAPYFKDTKILESLIGVALRLNAKATGVLWLNAARHRIFSPAEIELLKGLAAPASIALEQSELREKERDRATKLHALASVTNKIFRRIATSDRKKRLTLIAKFAHEIVDAETCAIFLVSQPGWLKLVASDGHREGGFEEGKPLRIISGKGTGLTGYIASTEEIFSECGEKLTNHFAVKDKIGGGNYSPSGACYSLLAIPLKREDGELVGLLRISNKNDRDHRPHEWTCFTTDDRSVGEVFAQAAMVAIETADLLDKIRIGQDRYRTILEASNVLALARVPEDGLRGLAKIVLGCIDRSFCRILFYREIDETLQVIAAEKAQGERGNFQWEQRLGKSTKVEDWTNLGQSLTSGASTVLKRGNPEHDPTLNQLSELAQLRDLQNNPLQINCMLRTPLKVNEQIIGLMTIGDLQANADFSAAEIEQARAISDQASRLIERLEREKKLLNDLFDTEREISASTDAERALKLITEQAYDVGRAYGRRVNVVDINVREGNKLRVVAAYPKEQGELIRSIVGDPFDLDAGLGEDRRLGIVGKVIVEGRPVIESDVRANSDYIPIHPDTLSQLVVPIKEGNQTVGAISVESSENAAFDKQDRLLLEGLAFQASSALSKEKQSREHKKVRTIALAGAAARLWRHGLKARAKKIIEQTELASQLAHSANISDALTKIKDDAKYIEDFHFTPLSSEEGVCEEVLNTVLQEYFETFQSYVKGESLDVAIQLSLNATRDRKIRVNKAWFQHALFILVENAHEAIKKATPKLIQVRTEPQRGSRSQILIKNTGAKIPDEIWDKMGNEQIPRSDGNTEKGGGLLIADLILAVYGGKLEKIENEENNIVMGLTLPSSP